MNAALEKPDTAIPSDEEAKLATESSRVLARLKGDEELKVRLDDGQELTIPRSATRLLSHILTEMSYGNAVTIIPVHAEMTTQEAANFLNVSRPHLVSLLERGEMKYHKVGSHRRVKFQELQDYKNRTQEESRAARKELAREAQEMGFGY